MMWSLILCLVSLTTAQVDPVTQQRLNRGPYVLYNFLDFDKNGNVTTAADVAGHSVIQFGSLAFNPQRASWLSGKPGVALMHETSLVLSAGMASVGNFNLGWINPFFSNPFVIEIWYQSSQPYESSKATMFSLAGPNTVAGTKPASDTFCSPTEPLMDLVLMSGLVYFRPATVLGSGCDYVLSTKCVQRNTTSVVALYTRYVPSSSKFFSFNFEDTGVTLGPTPGYTGSGEALQWVDTSARLAFSQSNNFANLDFKIFSFAIYPDMTDQQMADLYKAGLPNVKPVPPNFKRAVLETDGGIIRFCRNVPGTVRDSDCLDYTNNNATGTVHALLPSSSLTVTITVLPTKGTLYQGAVAITQVPTVLNSGNQVKFVPRPDETSWWLTYANGVYARGTGDYTSFQYTVRDPDGATSLPATVTIEVYPKHTASVSPNITANMIYAGRSIAPIMRFPSGGATNVIFLNQYVNREFIPPSATDLTCATANPIPNLCLLTKDRPPTSDVTVKIKSTPSKGKLKYGSFGQTDVDLIELASNMNVPLDNSVMCAGPSLCTPEQSTWLLYFDIPLNGYETNINEILDTTSFTYTTTTKFDIGTVLGSTRYNVDESDAPTSVGWNMTVESAPATVFINIRNGFYSRSASSEIKQQNLSSIEPQSVALFAEDLTVVNPSLSFKLLSLPSKGALFSSAESQIPISTVPYPLNGSTVYYQPSLPNEPYGFDFGNNYANFTFQTTSAGKTSNVATQTINVVDTNDAVRISWTPSGSLISYKRNGNPSKWSELAGNELKITMIDPDTDVADEPWYNVSLDAGPDFSIFIENSIYDELQVGKGIGNVGQQEGANAAGAGTRRWRFFAPRNLTSRALLSLRMRPNANVASTTMTVAIGDCIMQPGTAIIPFKSSPADWKSKIVTASIVLQGVLQEKAAYVPQADATVTGVIIGVASFVGLMFLICGYCLIKWCCRRGASAKGGSSKTAGGSTKTAGGSTKMKGKGKKAKSAYLHTVEL